ncbi:hypothetical protein [Sulfitobacter faviae]|uniref:hypothetical protein n=1 Tax=Sulfitobacter faviae TaxID=1775881 RepID=UPI00398C890C
MAYNPTLAAFLRLRRFSASDIASPLDRLTTANAAAWLAHAASYGITGEAYLLNEIADPKKNPVERAKTLARTMVDELTASGLPLSPPFQSVDLLYSAIEDQGGDAVELRPSDPFQSGIEQGPRP